MSKRWYGNVINRINEGKVLEPIKPGTDITMYLWSDRNCYYVTEVINEKCIKVRPYIICADRSKGGGMGHQDWLYFKTYAERDEYLRQFFPDHPSFGAGPEDETWVYRYGKWMQCATFTEENYCTERELKSLQKKGYYNRYYELSGKVSFGVRDYYYDWEF